MFDIKLGLIEKLQEKLKNEQRDIDTKERYLKNVSEALQMDVPEIIYQHSLVGEKLLGKDVMSAEVSLLLKVLDKLEKGK